MINMAKVKEVWASDQKATNSPVIYVIQVLSQNYCEVIATEEYNDKRLLAPQSCAGFPAHVIEH